MVRFASILLVLASLNAAGCTKYEYAIIDPPDLATTIAGKVESEFATESADYRLRVVENRLVMFIHNRGEAAVQLSGSGSVVVSPDGESHPIVGQTIPAGASIRLILPPTRPEIAPDYPAYGYGIGYGYAYGGGYYRGAGHGRPRYGDRGDRYHNGPYRPRFYGGPYDGPYLYDPPTYTVYDTSNPIYWDWSGETQVALTLAYDEGGTVTQDRFVIQRRKSP